MKNELKLIQAKMEEVKAFCAEVCPVPDNCYADDICELEFSVKCLYNELNSIYRYISSLEEALYRHASDGHCPRIPSPAAMQRVIDTLGLQDDYEVEKRTIYASDGAKTESFSLVPKVSGE